jgi:hypothetical protein
MWLFGTFQHSIQIKTALEAQLRTSQHCCQGEAFSPPLIGGSKKATEKARKKLITN